MISFSDKANQKCLLINIKSTVEYVKFYTKFTPNTHKLPAIEYKKYILIAYYLFNLNIYTIVGNSLIIFIYNFVNIIIVNIFAIIITTLVHFQKYGKGETIFLFQNKIPHSATVEFHRKSLAFPYFIYMLLFTETINNVKNVIKI